MMENETETTTCYIGVMLGLSEGYIGVILAEYWVEGQYKALECSFPAKKSTRS